MSVARKVEVNYDLKALSETARELGFLTQTHTGARGWYGIMAGAENCDLVITNPKHRFDMGFVQKDGKTKMFADFHGGHVQADMADQILPRYFERMTARSHRITERRQVGNEIHIRLERR